MYPLNQQVHLALFISFKRRFVTDIAEVVQGLHTPSVSMRRRYFSQLHQLMAVKPQGMRITVRPPVLEQGGINTDMGNADASVLCNGPEKTR